MSETDVSAWASVAQDQALTETARPRRGLTEAQKRGLARGREIMQERRDGLGQFTRTQAPVTYDGIEPASTISASAWTREYDQPTAATLVDRLSSPVADHSQAGAQDPFAGTTFDASAIIPVAPPVRPTRATTHPWCIHLCSSMNVPLSAVPKEIQFLEDKSQINEAFFKWKETYKPAEVVIDSAVLEFADNSYGAETSEDYKKQLKRADQMRTSIADYERSCAQFREDLFIACQRMELLKLRPGLKVSDYLKTIVADGWYTIRRVYNGAIEFYTPGSTVCSWVNVEAKIEMRVDMGQYLVLWKPGFAPAVHRYSNNITCNNYYHPHVNTSAEVCWGTATETVDEARTKGRIDVMLAALREILMNYNSASPYVAIAALAAKRDPSLLKDYPTRKVVFKYAWVFANDLPNPVRGYHKEYTGHHAASDKNVYKVKVYRDEYELCNIPVPDGPWYLYKTEGTHEPVENIHILHESENW